MGQQTVERWRTAHLGKRGDRFRLGGRQVWQCEWRWINKNMVRLPHPLHTSDVLSFMICEIGPATAPVRFAAAQVEPDMWAFYVPD
ncbi:hypothetical protein [Sphingomonas sp. TDK1]|uniref:hypothetical protein n=1 Tax=Sphingomonas sp. TDK1 TaxID=453247 RepID=UPI0007D90A8A|nr:hypothetical protein [Sphingomonas sp. TDK1]OAN66880.1 hypothetical protein A7X12_09680 [Sphingomonas sp. TDK1]